MSDALKALDAILQSSAAVPQAFAPTSRYHGLPVATLERDDGRTVAYLTRRFAPQPSSFVLVREHVVTEGERLDQLAFRYLGDPEQYWRLCDANGAVRPDELVETVGARLRVTLPEGVPGGGERI